MATKKRTLTKKTQKIRLSSTLKKNKAIAIQLTKAQNANSSAQLLKLLSPNFKSHISDAPHPLTKEQYIEGVKMSHQAFSPLEFTIEDVIAEKDKVVIRLHAKGKHIGKYQGISPTNKWVVFSGIAIRRIKNGKIEEEWQINDQLSLLSQIKSFQ